MESSGGQGGSDRPREFDRGLDVELDFESFGAKAGSDGSAGDPEPPAFVKPTPSGGTPPVAPPRRGKRGRGSPRGPADRAAAAHLRRPRPKRGTEAKTSARRPGTETLARVLWALPWIVFAITIVVLGGITFAGAMIVFAWIGLAELFRMTSSQRPLQLVAFGAAAGMIAAAYLGDQFQIVLAGAAAVPVMFGVAAARGSIDGATRAMAMTAFGILWIGLPFAHAVLLRELPDHGGALLIDVLVATFVADTSAYAVGRMVGRHKLAPDLSPNKTLEGMIGGFVGGTMGFWLAGLYQDWLPGLDAVLMGMVVAILAPIGDLFESMLKRDLGVKDSGHVFGPHGGLLDRLDAALFTVVGGYYLAVAFLY